jgi:hypothetical protein
MSNVSAPKKMLLAEICAATPDDRAQGHHAKAANARRGSPIAVLSGTS